MPDERYERLFRLAERFADERDELKAELESTRRSLAVLTVAALDTGAHTSPVLDELRKLREELGDPKVVYDNLPGAAPSGHIEVAA